MIPTGDWFYWVGGVGLIIAIAALVFVAWWALFADRPRGRRRCPRCWYDMAYSPGMTCSECGFTGRSEKDFSRTRRRWKTGLLAIIGGAIIGGYIIDKANQKGWPSYLPTNTLIWTLSYTSLPNGALYRELDNRMASNRLTDEQWLALLEKCAEGDTRSRPVDDEWLAKYGEILRIWRGSLLSRDDEEFRAEAERILLSLPPRLVFSTRDIWPDDVPASLDVQANDWWPNWAQIRVAATPDLPNAETDVHVRLNNPIQRRSYSLYLPPLEEGHHDVEIELEFSRRFVGAEGAEDWITLGNQTVTVPVDVEGKMADLMTPVDDEEMSQVMHDVFASQFLVKYSSGSLPVRVGLAPGHTFIEPFNDTAVGIRIDVLRNGVLGRKLDIWWEAGSGLDIGDRQYAWEVPWLDDQVLLQPDSEDDVWTVRVRGLPELALRVDGPSQYWAGEVEVEVPVRRQLAPAPSRGWIPESTIPDQEPPPSDEIR